MRKTFKSVGIISKGNDTESGPLVRTLCELIRKLGSQVYVETACGKNDRLPYPQFPIEQLGQHCDLVVIVGGDGTLLCAARHLAQDDIPLVGVNQGRLGFLVDISPKQINEKIQAILCGHYVEENRYLLSAEVIRQRKTIHRADALNDVVLYKWNTACMIEFDTHIDDRYLLTQRSDGMIISTPTGSTAYSLSGGGPIIHPSLNATLLLPICPHTLSNRPIVVSGNSCINIRLNNPDLEAQITTDGQDCFTITQDDQIVIRQKTEPIRLLHPPGYDYFNVLRAKLHWGSQNVRD